MKKIVLILTISCLFFIVNADTPEVYQQDTIQNLTEEELAVQDSVSIDDLDPVFYEAAEEEDEKKDGDNSWMMFVIAGIIVVGGGFFFLFRSRKSKQNFQGILIKDISN